MKSDKKTTYRHILEIYQMFCQGANSIDIVQYGAENWKIKQRGMYKLIKIALKWIKAKTEKDMDGLRLEANIRYDKLYTKLYKLNKFYDAGRIQALKNKINGLEVRDININHSGNIEINKFTDEELNEKIKSFLEERKNDNAIIIA